MADYGLADCTSYESLTIFVHFTLCSSSLCPLVVVVRYLVCFYVYYRVTRVRRHDFFRGGVCSGEQLMQTADLL